MLAELQVKERDKERETHQADLKAVQELINREKQLLKQKELKVGALEGEIKALQD